MFVHNSIATWYSTSNSNMAASESLTLTGRRWNLTLVKLVWCVQGIYNPLTVSELCILYLCRLKSRHQRACQLHHTVCIYVVYRPYKQENNLGRRKRGEGRKRMGVGSCCSAFSHGVPEHDQNT